MRILFSIMLIVLAVTLPVEAQNSTYATPHTQLDLINRGDHTPYVRDYIETVWSRDDWNHRTLKLIADIHTEGRCDTSMGDTLVYIGSVISLAQCDSLMHLLLAGRDSGTVIINYRWITMSSDAIGYGAWQPWDSTTGTFTNTLQRTIGAGGGYDSLVSVPPPAAAINQWNYNHYAYVQLKYIVINTRANDNDGGAKDIERPGGRYNYTWNGESNLVFRRKP